jgi:phospholipase C
MGWRRNVKAALQLVAFVFVTWQCASYLFAQEAGTGNGERGLVNTYYIAPDSEPKTSHRDLIQALRQKVKYVFVLYQENRSFDSFFGTYPGADGLFSNPSDDTPGFYQELVNTDGTRTTIHPFRIGAAQFAADTDDIDHSHDRIVAKMNIQNGVPRMDKFARTEELKYSPTGNPSLKAKQFGELAMAYEDCDTVPLLWSYADKFVLFDHIFQEMSGPSTPGNLAIIGAQTGVTQWVLHPEEAWSNESTVGVPVINDDDPFWGSQLDRTPPAQRMPVNPSDFANGVETSGPQINLTFATLPLTLQLGSLQNVTKTDQDPSDDLADVKDDVPYISRLSRASVPFGWFQEGYDKEPTDPNLGPTDANGTHASYITHHNGPQYFGYMANNPQLRQQLHGLQDFFNALAHGTLPPQGGAFYVKGGYQNLFKLTPSDPAAIVQKNFLGDDEHPGYSDAQISDAMVAEAVNAIAASPYWNHCAIIITFDDSEGDYDHVPPPVRTFGPDGSEIADGPRVPLLVISPYARTHYIAHEQGDHASVVKFIDRVFSLPPLATLPDELKARKLGATEIPESGLGPEDAITPDITDLLGAFSPSRLTGKAHPLPPEYVELPDSLVLNLPAKTGLGCGVLGILTTDRQKGIANKIPTDFNPRPSTQPSPAP